MNSKTKRITVIGMLCAITYVTMVVGRIPIILFLKYDPSDVIVTLGGFIWGPMTSCIVSVIVATLEMITVSDTGILGCIMNIVQTLSFACTASVIYKKKHTLSGAVIGLASGWLITVIVMLLWNYLVSTNLDQVVQRIDTPSTAVPVPVPFPGHIYQTVMLLMPEIRSIPFQHAGFMELQVSKQVSFPRCLNLFFGYAGHSTGTVFLFIVLCLLPVMK